MGKNQNQPNGNHHPLLWIGNQLENGNFKANGGSAVEKGSRSSSLGACVGRRMGFRFRICFGSKRVLFFHCCSLCLVSELFVCGCGMRL